MRTDVMMMPMALWLLRQGMENKMATTAVEKLDTNIEKLAWNRWEPLAHGHGTWLCCDYEESIGWSVAAITITIENQGNRAVLSRVE